MANTMKRFKSPLFRSLARTLAATIPAALIAGCATEAQDSAQKDENVDESAAALGVEIVSCSQAGSSGYSTSTGNLTIGMGAVTSLVLGVVNGYVTVNGYPCVKPTAAGGAKLTPALVKKVSILGTTGDDKIVIDTLSGSLGGMVSQAGGITIDFNGAATPAGDNFSLRGSNASDKWTAGADASNNLYFEVSGDKYADIMVKGAQSVAVSLSAGADTFTAQGGALTASHLAGSSLTSLNPVAAALTINGGDGDDVITGGNGDDVINGGNGNDTFKAAAGDGNDTFNGGAGTDKADYSARTADLTIKMDGTTASGDLGANEADLIGSDVEDLVGGSGNDTLTGNANSNHIQGGLGDDKLSGGANAGSCTNDNDTLDGEAGNDIFDQGTVPDCGDVMNGGAGIDRVDYQGRTADLTISLDTAANDGDSSVSEKDNVKSDVEIVISGSGNDTITGSPNADILHGGPGNDTISGGAGNDTISGDTGNDILNGEVGDDVFAESGTDLEYTVAELAGAGNDIINGGSHDSLGVDTVDYSQRTNDLTVTLCMDSAHLTGAGSANIPACADADGEATESDSVVNVTHLIAGSGNDIITGSAADDILEGGAGDDQLSGGAGADSLFGDAGDDTLIGGDGDDYLESGAHTTADTLDGDGGGGTAPGDGDVCVYDTTTDTASHCEL
jgi:Ca2+-binding RTX toxin-like protein